MLKIRSGIGYDCHRIKEGGSLNIGGIKVADNRSFIAHSDGDPLIHALIDSLLGAIGSELDIGQMFPDSDPRYRDIPSLELLAEVKGVVDRENVEIMNIDCVIICEDPPIGPVKGQIRQTLADALKIEVTDINVKAKSKEKMGAVGRGEAVEVFCISMIRQRS